MLSCLRLHCHVCFCFQSCPVSSRVLSLVVSLPHVSWSRSSVFRLPLISVCIYSSCFSFFSTKYCSACLFQAVCFRIVVLWFSILFCSLVLFSWFLDYSLLSAFIHCLTSACFLFLDLSTCLSNKTAIASVSTPDAWCWLVSWTFPNIKRNCKWIKKKSDISFIDTFKKTKTLSSLLWYKRNKTQCFI